MVNYKDKSVQADPLGNFVAVYNTAMSEKEVVEKTGLPRARVSVCAFALRTLGVELKRFKDKRPKVTASGVTAHLNKIAREAYERN